MMNTAERLTVRVAVYLILERDGQILLLKRKNTGWADGLFSFISGHLDPNETLTTAMIREAKEEAGIDMQEKDLEMVHVIHLKTNQQYIAFFFKAKQWAGEPTNIEAEKCEEMKWFPINNIPSNTVSFLKGVIEHYKAGTVFSESLS